MHRSDGAPVQLLCSTELADGWPSFVRDGPVPDVVDESVHRAQDCGRRVSDGPEGGVNDGAGTERRGHGRREHNTQIAVYTLL